MNHFLTISPTAVAVLSTVSPTKLWLSVAERSTRGATRQLLSDHSPPARELILLLIFVVAV